MARELAILVTARSLAGRVLGDVRRDIGGIEGAARRAGQNMGRNLSIGAGIAAAGIATQVHAGINSLIELERVENLTAAALESTGNVAGQSAAGIRARAEAMERMSGVDDKAVQEAQNLLLTFTNVREDAFEPTLEAALNLNAALGGNDESLQGVLLQVAKAINDPVRGMTALRRSGVSFTQAQQNQVKAMVEANDLMGAQALILGELETQFGGAAAAANQGAGAAQKKFADAIEDMQMALATGFLPLIERVSGKMQELVADPAFLKGVEEFGAVLASGFDEALDFAEGIPWGTIGSAFSIMGTGARMAMDAFLSAPPWLQTAILTGWGLNKLTGGALGGIVGELGKGLIRGILNMNAGVVNVRGAVVNAPGGGGGMPGAPGGRGPGGFLGGLAGGLAVGAGVAAAGVAAVEVINFETMRNEQRAGLQGILDEMPRTPARIDAAIAAIEGQINQERPWLEGILFNTNVRPQLERELEELRNVKAAQERAISAARDAIPWAQRNVTATQTADARAAAAAAAQTGRLAIIEGVSRESIAVQRGILAKRTVFSPIIQAMITNSINVHEWQRTVTSSVRAGTPTTQFQTGPI